MTLWWNVLCIIYKGFYSMYISTYVIMLYKRLYCSFLTLSDFGQWLSFCLERCEHHVTFKSCVFVFQRDSMNHMGGSRLLGRSDTCAFWLACKAISVCFSPCWTGPWPVTPCAPSVPSFFSHHAHSSSRCHPGVSTSAGWFHLASWAAPWPQLGYPVTAEFTA